MIDDLKKALSVVSDLQSVIGDIDASNEEIGYAIEDKTSKDKAMADASDILSKYSDLLYLKDGEPPAPTSNGMRYGVSFMDSDEQDHFNRYETRSEAQEFFQEMELNGSDIYTADLYYILKLRLTNRHQQTHQPAKGSPRT